MLATLYALMLTRKYEFVRSVMGLVENGVRFSNASFATILLISGSLISFHVSASIQKAQIH